MKKRLCLSLVGLLALTALNACGEQGPQGERGSDGANGLNGTDGRDGIDGKDGVDGSKILTGSGEPSSSSGTTGDIYIDVETGDMYSKGESGWAKTGNIKGEKGDKGDTGENGTDGRDGKDGTDGKDGSSLLTGNGEPSEELGDDGDSYIDLESFDYYVKENGSWLKAGNIKGKDAEAEERMINYEFYQILYYSGGKYQLNLSEQIQGVSNPNPDSVSGKPGDLASSLKDASKEGYCFLGWYEVDYNGEFSKKITNFHDGYFGATICGLFSAPYSISIASEDETEGKVEFVGGEKNLAGLGEKITVEATPAEGFDFIGWYDGENLVNMRNPYTFSMPMDDCSLIAKFGPTADKRKEVLDEFISNVSSNNITMTVTGCYDNGEVTFYYLGDEAVVSNSTAGTDGLLVNKDQGIFSFTLDGDTLNIGGCQGLGDNLGDRWNAIPKFFAHPDFFNYINLRGDDYSFDLDTWAMIDDFKSYMNGGTGSNCLWHLLQFPGFNCSAWYKYLSSANLTIAPDGSYADVTVKLGQLLSFSCHLFDFGKTDVEAVSNYLADPQDIVAPTDWDEDCSSAIGSVFPGKESDVIFPKGLISASFCQSTLVDIVDANSENTIGVQWTHYGDDLTENYGTLLQENGYENAGSQMNEFDGYTHFYYRKEYIAQTENKGASYIQCDWYYVSSTKEFTCQITFVQDALRYENLSLSDANAKIDEINVIADYDIPSLTESETIMSISVADYTSVYEESDNVSYACVFDIFFEKEEDAEAYGEAYIKSISNYYSQYRDYIWDEDKTVQYTAGYNAYLIVTESEVASGGYVIEIVVEAFAS